MLHQTVATALPAWAVDASEDREWSQRVGGLCLLPGLLGKFGVDAATILARAGLSASALDHADNRVSYAAAGRLLTASAQAAQRPDFGLLAGQLWTLELMGLVGELLRHSATLGDALRTLAVYQRLNSEGGAVFLLDNKESAALGYVVHQPRVDGIEHIYDTVLASGWSLTRQLLGQQANLLKVTLARSRPTDPQPYRDCFQCRVQFDSDHSALYLPRRLLDQPVPGADPQRRRELERQIEAATATDLLVRLHRALRLLLLTGEGSGDFVAQQLAMHRRTLHRRLKSEGTTFQQVLDDVRWDLARQLLGHTALTLGKVAAATGYADTSTFVRAFHRWSGTTPAKWRTAQGREP